MRSYDLETLIANFKKKDKIALARLITLIENEPERAHEVFKHFESVKHESYIIGLTGSPGVGKSTLTGAIAQKMLDEGKTVGIISVDPTSPFSGGAFLGDRVRMTNISLHPNVFMRSLASRGYKGGISRAVFDITMLYEAFGIDIIIIETVGVGQALVPGYGDVIQMQKAGIIEIGDIYDVNKKDLGGEDIAVQIEMMLDDTIFQSGYRPPVVLTDAIKGEGIDDLLQYIWEHKEHMELSGTIKEKQKDRFNYKIKELVFTKVEKLLSEKVLNESKIKEIVDDAMDNSCFSIYDKVHNLFEKLNFKIDEE